MIVIKTNLNPLFPEYHNVGYTDLNSGYGYVYNGETWEKKCIKTIMDDLLNSKRNDLIKIYEEIKDYLSEENNKNIGDRLDGIDNDIEPIHEHHAKSKKRLVINLKTRFYNNRHLILDSIKNSKKPIKEVNAKNTTKNILKDGLTIEELDVLLTTKKIKKELAMHLLNQSNNNKTQHKLLSEIIGKTTDVNILNIIIRALTKTICFGDDINSELIKNNIDKEAEINELLSQQ